MKSPRHSSRSILSISLSLSVAFASVLSAATIDDNSNGMSDVWEAAYGRTLSPNQDADGDGRTNLQESIAGTDPTKAASFLQPQSFTLENGNLAKMRWASVPGKSYQVEVSFDLATWHATGLPRTGTGEVIEVQMPLESTFLTGTAPISRWNGMASGGLSTVRSNIVNNVPPSITGFLSLLETPQTSPDTDNYGQWVRGWIVPPTTGNYTFWIASDDSSEFWLSPNSQESGKQLRASVSGWTSFRQWTKYPTQQSVAISLNAGQSYYFEAIQKEGTGGDHLSVAWSGPGFATQTVISGEFLASSGASIQQQAANGLWFRLRVADLDSDNDGVADSDELLVGYNPSNPKTVPRVADAGNIRSALASQNIVTVGAPISRAYEAGQQPGRFTFFRSGSFDPLTIQFSISGTAGTGDYTALPGSVYLPVGQNSVSIDLHPTADGEIEPGESVTLRVLDGTAYQPGNPGQASVKIDDAPDVLFVANLRPDPAVRSGGYGTVALNAAGNAVFADIGVSFGNLLSSPVRTELYISDNNGATGLAVLQLPAGQITSTRWEFDPTANYSREDILSALDQGRLYARILSETHPAGEIFGKLTAQMGWQTMPQPPTPPSLPGGPLLSSEAARFLVQATYGPTQTAIEHLQVIGIDAWLEEQRLAPATLHLPLVTPRRAELLAASGGADDGWQGPRQEAWWQIALTAPDQLRQRMALALSEIFVVSDIGVLDGSHEGITNYYDMLVTEGFGNYRDLLEKVTLSPIMGQYLSMVRNQKPNPETGSEPDENYAREIMQLFSIGLSQLHPDGSLKLGSTGMPIPTYTQSDIVGLAHVFTGWSYQTLPGNSPNFLYGPRDEMNPMAEFPAYHDTSQKTIVNNTLIPANQTMGQDMDMAMDALFYHPNTGPFVARQLIQRFVTSNPSAGYIYRVASVFHNNGQGVRGDLWATLKAVLLDYEARSNQLLNDVAHGKQKEPIIRMAHLLRAMNARPPKPGDSRFFIDLQYSLTAQAALKSPSVFNFFQPGYIPPGTLAFHGLFAPEFQITSETTVVNQNNNQHAAIFWGIWTREKINATENYTVRLDVSAQTAILNRPGYTAQQNQEALLDNLSLLLLNGRMSAGLRQNIMTAYATLPAWFNSAQNQTDRVNMALWVITASPEFVIQK